MCHTREDAAYFLRFFTAVKTLQSLVSILILFEDVQKAVLHKLKYSRGGEKWSRAPTGRQEKTWIGKGQGVDTNCEKVKCGVKRVNPTQNTQNTVKS